MKSYKKLLKNITVVLTAILVSISFASAKTPKDTLVVALTIDDIISLDPAEIFEFSGAELAGQTYDRLINYDYKDVSKIKGQVAKSWKVSKDNLTYIFEIRKKIKFASGNKLRAEDVVFSLRRAVLLNKSPAFIITQFGWNAKNVKKMIYVSGKNQVTIKVSKPFAPTFVLYSLTSTVASVVDEKLVMSHQKNGDFGYNWLKTNYAGSGPFKIKSWKPSQSVILLRNSNYWGKVPAMKRVVIRHIPETVTQQLMLEKGDIDIARNLDADQIKALANSKDIKIQRGVKGAVYYLGLNQKNKYLKIPEVVKALKYLVDYKGISTTILDGKAKIHQAFLPIGFLGASSKKPYSKNVQKAKKLLKKAGLEKGFKITMEVRDTKAITSMAQSIQATFAEANIKLDLIPGTGKQTLTKYRARKHDIYIGRWGPDYQDPHTNADTFARNPDNSDDASAKPLAWRNSWNIPKLTKKTDAAVMERNSVKRSKLYLKIQDVHQKTSPFVVMFQDIEVAGVKSNVKNFIIGPSFDSNSYQFVTK